MKKQFERILALTLALVLTAGFLSTTARAEDYSGTCGDDLTWTLDPDTGVLTISGTGAMENYSTATPAPWSGSNFSAVDIPDGVTAIGERAFSGCPSLTSVTIPNSVTTIGTGAFSSSGLTSVTIPDSVTDIAQDLFLGCTALTSAELPDSVAHIMPYAFSGTGLTSITIPASVTTIGREAFANCTSLETVTFSGDAPAIYGTNDSATAAFAGVGDVTFCYPEGNTTWDSLKDQTFGAANPTWQAYDPSTSDTDPSTPDTDPTTPGTDPTTPTDPTIPDTDPTVPTDPTTPDTDPSAPGTNPSVPGNAGQTTAPRPGNTSGSGSAAVPSAEPEWELPGAGVNPPPASAPSVSPIQGIVTDEKDVVDWGERIQLPDYARKLYDMLTAGSSTQSTAGMVDFLVEDEYFVLPAGSDAAADQEVLSIERVDFDLADVFGDGTPSLGVSVFENDDFYHVDATTADRQVDYAALQTGDVVRTANYNGLFVTSLDAGEDFDEAKKLTCTYICTVFQAFDRDHPEVFWLSGQCRISISTVRSPDGAARAYFFLELANKDGFTMRSPAWTKDGAVASGIQRREKAVEAILGTVTAETPAETVRQLNRWLTEHNEYNTTPDLTKIGNEPHECLSALEGRTGTDGPVCDGYSRAFKVLCDRLGISCVLENGCAKTSPEDKGSLHMWNAVQIGGAWYGMDVTWNDPVVKNAAGAKSGEENEQFLLVGASTVVLGMRFDASHPATNQASADGVSFNNGPELSAAAFSAGTANAGLYALPFADVPADAWHYGSVSYVYQRDLMLGTDAATFTPNGLTTRQQLWMILARMDGARPLDMAAARDWAVSTGVSDGTDPGGTLTREQLVSMLYRYCGLKGYDTTASASLAEFTDGGAVAEYARDAMSWAAAQGIVTGMGDGTVAPGGTATRAQMAAIVERFCQRFAQ